MSKRIIGGTVFLIAIALVIGIIFLTRKEKINYLVDVHSKSPLGIYNHFAISTDASECAPLARRILEKNGTAIDAAITTLLCMSLVLPHSLGLGGGAFINYYDKKTGKAYIYDGREQAPQHVKTTKFNKTNLQDGLLSIAIPGELKAYKAAHEDYGKLPWADLFKEPIELARKGVRVNAHLAGNIVKNEKRLSGPLREILTNKKTGKLLVENDTLVREDLADTYERIANSEDPVNLFYNGELADQFVEELNGSGITKQDFNDYVLKKNEAIIFDLDDENRLFASTLPSSGLILGFIMKIVAELRSTIIKPGMEYSLKNTALFYHQLTEAFKHAYSRRSLVSDPDFEPFDTRAEFIKNFTNFDKNDKNSYFNEVLNKIKNSHQTHDQSFYGGKEYFIPDNGTAAMSIIDQWGNAISVTSTVNIYFGSGIVSKTGILFNDEHDDFSVKGITNYFGLPASKANLIEPGKRPASSMCPTIVINRKTNEAKLSIGAAGGSLIISGLVESITRILYMNENIKVSIDQLRYHHQLYPNVFQYEKGFNLEILKELNETYKHAIEPIPNRKCIISAVSKIDGKLYSNTDFRKGGSIDGL